SHRIYREAYLEEVKRMEEEASRIIEDARVEAEREASSILVKAEEMLDELRAKARDRFEEAVKLVLKEVMEGSL
ncbi:MAG: hypothetical protein QXI98_05940, partial [Candidatus Bathyarchaeia archaeon]